MLSKSHKTPTPCDQCTAALFTVISGSYRKHLQQIIELKQALQHQHVAVLSPSGEAAVNPDEEFIILDSDPVTNPKLLQDSVFTKIRRSTFLTVANIDGYLGRAAVLEIGYAICLGISIYTLEPVEDPNISPYCRPLSEIFPNISISPSANIEDPEVDLQLSLLQGTTVQKICRAR